MIITATQTFEVYDGTTATSRSAVYMARLSPESIVLCNRVYQPLATLTYASGAELIAVWNGLVNRPDVVQAWPGYDGEGRHAVWFDRGSRDHLTPHGADRGRAISDGRFERRSVLA